MDLVIGLVVVVLVVWLAQTLLGAFEIKEPANKIIFVVVLLLAIFWFLTGHIGIVFPR